MSKSISVERFYEPLFQKIRICDLTSDPTMANIYIYIYPANAERSPNSSLNVIFRFFWEYCIQHMLSIFLE